MKKQKLNENSHPHAKMMMYFALLARISKEPANYIEANHGNGEGWVDQFQPKFIIESKYRLTLEGKKLLGIGTGKKKEWYENITKPVICWVSDCDKDAKNMIRKITAYEPVHSKSYPYRTNGEGWTFATPLTKVEKHQFNQG